MVVRAAIGHTHMHSLINFCVCVQATNDYLDVFEEFLNLDAELTRESQEIAMSSQM